MAKQTIVSQAETTLARSCRCVIGEFRKGISPFAEKGERSRQGSIELLVLLSLWIAQLSPSPVTSD